MTPAQLEELTGWISRGMLLPEAVEMVDDLTLPVVRWHMSQLPGVALAIEAAEQAADLEIMKSLRQDATSALESKDRTAAAKEYRSWRNDYLMRFTSNESAESDIINIGDIDGVKALETSILQRKELGDGKESE